METKKEFGTACKYDFINDHFNSRFSSTGTQMCVTADTIPSISLSVFTHSFSVLEGTEALMLIVFQAISPLHTPVCLRVCSHAQTPIRQTGTV